MSLKPLAAILVLLGVVAYLLMNAPLIKDQTLKWVEKNPTNPEAPAILMRSAIWCDWTGGDQEAFLLFRTIWEKYPENGPMCARALYETAYIISQGTARRNANPFLQRVFDEYPDQEEWRLKARALWDEVNHAL